MKNSLGDVLAKWWKLLCHVQMTSCYIKNGLWDVNSVFSPLGEMNARLHGCRRGGDYAKCFQMFTCFNVKNNSNKFKHLGAGGGGGGTNCENYIVAEHPPVNLVVHHTAHKCSAMYKV